VPRQKHNKKTPGGGQAKRKCLNRWIPKIGVPTAGGGGEKEREQFPDRAKTGGVSQGGNAIHGFEGGENQGVGPSPGRNAVSEGSWEIESRRHGTQGGGPAGYAKSSAILEKDGARQNKRKNTKKKKKKQTGGRPAGSFFLAPPIPRPPPNSRLFTRPPAAWLGHPPQLCAPPGTPPLFAFTPAKAPFRPAKKCSNFCWARFLRVKRIEFSATTRNPTGDTVEAQPQREKISLARIKKKTDFSGANLVINQVGVRARGGAGSNLYSAAHGKNKTQIKNVGKGEPSVSMDRKHLRGLLPKTIGRIVEPLRLRFDRPLRTSISGFSSWAQRRAQLRQAQNSFGPTDEFALPGKRRTFLPPPRVSSGFSHHSRPKRWENWIFCLAIRRERRGRKNRGPESVAPGFLWAPEPNTGVTGVFIADDVNQNLKLNSSSLIRGRSSPKRVESKKTVFSAGETKLGRGQGGRIDRFPPAQLGSSGSALAGPRFPRSFCNAQRGNGASWESSCSTR